MEHMKRAASYLCDRYEKSYGVRIDEMKLHKLMYFAQRESLIQYDRPLFEDAEFEGWRFGPVLPKLRDFYKADDLHEAIDGLCEEDKDVLDDIFEEYADSDSWNLSSLSHGEICWKRSRKGISPTESSRNTIPLEDIRIDAVRMRERRTMLQLQGLL